MHSSKGSFSIIFIAALLYLTAFAHLLLYHLQNDYMHTYDFSQNLQQRRLCASIFTWFAEQPDTLGNIDFQHTLTQASTNVNITSSRAKSSDEMFAYLTTNIAVANSEQKLKQLLFYPNEHMKNLGEQYMFISKYALTGSEYLDSDTLYTSNTNLTMPQIDFLAGKARSQLSMSDLHDYGFSKNFIYLTSGTTLTYLSTAKTTKGDELLACKGSITLKKNFKATGRLILITNSSVTLEEKVDLANVLIIAKGNVNINAGCKINGVIFSGSTVKILGSSTFTHDASVVANYASAIFIA